MRRYALMREVCFYWQRPVDEDVAPDGAWSFSFWFYKYVAPTVLIVLLSSCHL